MQINFLAVIWCAIIAMAVGALWYGPLFGKKWAHLTGITHLDETTKKKRQKQMLPIYGLQFVLVLFQVFVLTDMTSGYQLSGIFNAVLTWAAFVMPSLWAANMWAGDSQKVAWTKFFIQAGYQLIMFVIFGAILGFWL